MGSEMCIRDSYNSVQNLLAIMKEVVIKSKKEGWEGGVDDYSKFQRKWNPIIDKKPIRQTVKDAPYEFHDNDDDEKPPEYTDVVPVVVSFPQNLENESTNALAGGGGTTREDLSNQINDVFNSIKDKDKTGSIDCLLYTSDAADE